ncbi:hypothetical protein ACVVIH_08585 [Chryseobacterium arthrosphaerae]
MAVTQLYSSDFYMNIHQSPGQDTMLFRISVIVKERDLIIKNSIFRNSSL